MEYARMRAGLSGLSSGSNGRCRSPENVDGVPGAVTRLRWTHSGAMVYQAFRQAVACFLHGHDDLIHFDRSRIWMQCQTCGRETPGWECGE